MVDLVHEALRLQHFLDGRHWSWCFIGGLAVQAWGEPRLTRDIDLSLFAGFGAESDFIDTLLSGYEPRLVGAREFAISHRILLLRSAMGVPIDVSLAALPYEEAMIARATLFEMLPGSSLRVCSPEDLIVMKIFAGRISIYATPRRF